MFCLLLAVSFFFFLARLIAVVSIISVVLYVILALWQPVLEFQLPALLFVLCLICFVFVVCTCFVWRTKAETRARVSRPQISSSPRPLPPVILLQAVPKRLPCFGCLAILDAVCCYLLLFLLYINVK